MTRKDYIEVSTILNRHRDAINPDTFLSILNDFAFMMESDNPRFDRSRFFDAAFLGQGVKA